MRESRESRTHSPSQTGRKLLKEAANHRTLGDAPVANALYQ
jgi:hypothetical protein